MSGRKAEMRAEFKQATIQKDGGLVIQLIVEDVQAGNALDFIGVMQGGVCTVKAESDQRVLQFDNGGGGSLSAALTIDPVTGEVETHMDEAYSPLPAGIAGTVVRNPQERTA